MTLDCPEHFTSDIFGLKQTPAVSWNTIVFALAGVG